MDNENTPINDDDKLLTIDDLCELTQESKPTWRHRLFEANEVPWTDLSVPGAERRRPRVLKGEYRRWLKAKTRGGATEAEEV